jgi:hypothetical protein
MKFTTATIIAGMTMMPAAQAQTARAGLSGMPIEQVRTALAAASYACKPFGNEADFTARVAAEVKSRTGTRGQVPYTTGTMQFDCTGPNREGLRVTFAQAQTGSVVDGYSLDIDGRSVDLPALRRQLTAKYGRPMVGTEMHGSWCDAGYRCGDGWSSARVRPSSSIRRRQ